MLPFSRPLNLRAPVEAIFQSAVGATYRSAAATIATNPAPFSATYLSPAHNREERERESASSHRLFNGPLTEDEKRALMGFHRFDRFGRTAPVFPPNKSRAPSPPSRPVLHRSLARFLVQLRVTGGYIR